MTTTVTVDPFYFPPKSPGSKLPYIFDFAAEDNNNGLSNWLEDGEKIASFTISISPSEGAPTNEGDGKMNDDKSVYVWLDGGTDQADYDIICEFTTDSVPPKTDQRTAILPVRTR